MPQEPTLEEQLLRIAQEALHNVVKHAKASAVKVSLSCDARQVYLSIIDNGQGFRMDSVKQPMDILSPSTNSASQHGFGLANMEERASAAGGQLRLLSEPHKGSTVEVRIPIRHKVK